MLLRAAGALALLIVPVAAATASPADLTRSGGVLGGTLQYDVLAAPSTLYVLGLSLNTGPTPLALADPTDPRVLDLGIDLLPFWTLGLTDGGGAGTNAFPLPANPGLNGVALHAQVVEMPFAPTTFGAISPLNTITLGSFGQSALTFGEAYANLAGHTSTLLDDGRVLVAGGYSDPAGPVNTLGLFDPQTETMVQSAVAMQDSRFVHTATKLDDGRVLLIGGLDDNEDVVPSAVLYDPVTDTLTQTPPMTAPRALHTATKLADGRVLVIGGGHTFPSDLFEIVNSLLATSELFDPTTDTWSPGPSLPGVLAAHNASLLHDGRVLVTGGLEVISLFGIPTPIVTEHAHLYDPVSNSFGPAADMPAVRGLHSQLTLSDGRVVVAGGADASLIPLVVTPLTSTATYFTGFDAWVPNADLNHPRGYATLHEHNGSLWMMGGISSIDLTAIDPETPGEPTIERTDLTLTTWDAQHSLVKARMFGGAFTPIDGGARVLVTGEADDNDPLVYEKTCELFTP